jgi:ElaB/YqjD/DUF883 family membrane-anchored ribosome-binding protein
MLTRKSSEPVISLAGQTAQSADVAVKSTQRAASEALESLVQAAHEIRDDAVAPLLNRAAEQASAFATRGVDAVRQGSQQVRARAQQASLSTVNYVKGEPVKAMLIAAATGAALLAIVRLLTRPRDRA